MSLLTRSEAAEVLCVVPQYTAVLAAIPRSYKGNGPKSGSLYHREQIERIARIRRECRVSASVAIRVEAALREGRIG